MVSVVIPTYNRSAFLKEAVASVLAQTAGADEVIVVDDGSTDETPSVLEEFGSAVRCLRRENSGVSAARNAGIEAARGEWLAFLDSDDLWRPRKLEVQLAYLSARPDIKICQVEEIWVRNGKRLNPRKYHEKPSGFCFPLLLERCLVSPSAVIIHRDLFEEVGLFDETLPACEDYDLWLRIGSRYALGLVEEPLVVKRGGHPDQLSSSIPALDQYRIRALEKLLRSGRIGPDQQLLALRELDRKCAIYADGCARRGRHDIAESIRAIPLTVSRDLGIPRPVEGGPKGCEPE